MKKRLYFLISLYLVISFYLLFTCASICFVKGPEYTKSVISQRKTSYVIKKHRGKFLDRNMIPLVETERMESKLSSDGSVSSSGSIELPYITKRYGKDALACHLIGYTDCDGIGVCGLEKVFEEVLSSDGESTVNAVLSANGQIIDKLGISLSENFSDTNDVVLTLDVHIQKIAQEALKKFSVTGAVVVLDTKTGEILAMASSPIFDQNSVKDYLSLTEGELINRCIMPYNAGSIFKIITLSSALESGHVRQTYTCDGKSEIMGRYFACHKAEGHGTLNYMSALSNSCNCSFYTMGMDTGARNIINTASAFGIGQKLSGSCIPDESIGNLPSPESLVPLDSVNLAIGQGEILITPLQAANMARIIANGGFSSEISIFKGISDKSGNLSPIVPAVEPKQVLNSYCASLISEAMRMTVTDGTASFLRDNPSEIAGKTGTAETGWEKDGNPLVHGWFCGFFPYSSPRFAAAVLAEGGGSGSKSAAPVFGYIAERIMEIYPTE